MTSWMQQNAASTLTAAGTLLPGIATVFLVWATKTEGRRNHESNRRLIESNRHLINHDLGEWIFLAREDGTPVWSHLGNNWKVNYHSGRSATEALLRLDRLLRSAAPVLESVGRPGALHPGVHTNVLDADRPAVRSAPSALGPLHP